MATISTLTAFPNTEIDSGIFLASDGALYGTTTSDRSNYDGTAYKVTTGGVLTVLHTFNGADGSGHKSALIEGRDGNFYGTTYNGGGSNDGTVFRMTPTGTVRTLHSFAGGTEGAYPDAALVQGGDGNFYGVTAQGGTGSDGTVFKITPAGVLTTLYSFTNNSDGKSPSQPLARGSDGNFYGVTYTTIFKITPAGALTTIHQFNFNTEGAEPQGGLVQGSDSNFYGTANGGPRGCGTVFKVTPSGALTLLAVFDYGNGEIPNGTLALDSKGNLYGTSENTVFRVNPAGELAVLYSLSGTGGVVLDSSGNLYGVGAAENTIFKLTVSVVHPPFFLGEASLATASTTLRFPRTISTTRLSAITATYPIRTTSTTLIWVTSTCLMRTTANRASTSTTSPAKRFFYTSPEFPFPYLYDFTLKTVLYYYPDPNNAGRYNTDGVRYFYDFATGQTITK